MQQPLQKHGVAFINLTRLKFFSRSYKLVTSRNNCRTHLATDHYLVEPLRDEQCGRCRANTFALGENFLALAEITTTSPHEFARIDLHIHDDLASFARDIFLHHDRVRAGRHWRARENADRFASRHTELLI